MLREQFKLDAKNIVVLKNQSKEQILNIFDALRQDADKFQQDPLNDTQSVKTIFITFVGFKLYPKYHPYMK